MGSHSGTWGDLPTDPDELDSLTNGARKHIKPWLSAVFQAEHLNLLLGSGFTTAVGYIAGVGATGMAKVTFGTPYDAAIDAHAQAGATVMKRGAANIEDQFRGALALLDGLGVIDKGAEQTLKDGINAQMSGILTSLLKTENGIVSGTVEPFRAKTRARTFDVSVLTKPPEGLEPSVCHVRLQCHRILHRLGAVRIRQDKSMSRAVENPAIMAVQDPASWVWRRSAVARALHEAGACQGAPAMTGRLAGVGIKLRLLPCELGSG